MKNLKVSKKNLKFEYNTDIEMVMNFLLIENIDRFSKKAIKLKCTDIDSFLVKPRKIILNPLESVNIKIGFISKNKKKEDLNDDDYFCIYAVDIFQHDSFDNYFKKNKKYVEKKKIKIIFEKAHNLNKNPDLVNQNNFFFKKKRDYKTDLITYNTNQNNSINQNFLKSTLNVNSKKKMRNYKTDQSYPNTNRNSLLKATINDNSIISSTLQINNKINSLKENEMNFERSRILELENYKKLSILETEKRIEEIKFFNEILEKDIKIMELCISRINYKVEKNVFDDINIRVIFIVFCFGVVFGFFLNN